MKLSVLAFTVAAALVNALSFAFIAAMNRLLPPYGGAYLELLRSLYPGYDPMMPLSPFIGIVYALAGGAVTGAIFAWLYNRLFSRSG
jgi:hypothetical protein